MSNFERLLQERTQIEQWLKKLSSSADRTPANVRERVKADYQKRHDEVQEELNGHRDEITETLERHRSVRDELVKQQEEAEEKRAEAELRHTVGEYDDAKWDGIREEIDGSLGKIREELGGVDTEIADLEKALDSIVPSADTEEQTQKALKEESSPPHTELQTPQVEDLPPPIRDSQPAIAPATSVEPAGRGSDGPSDDLEFLDVDKDSDSEPASEPPRVSDTVPMPPDAAELLGEGKSGKETDGEPSGSEVGAEGVTSFSENTEQPKKGAAKTLKCGECGAMNLPTEWYCERCGAELAAL